jgi:hypothetical membrane protein
MTSTGLRHDTSAPHWSDAPHITRKAIIAFGAAASILYVLIDLLAGLRYDGYSFYSQTISELGAIGAPKPSWLLPLFLTYSVLMVAFGIDVLVEGARTSNRLKIVGALLLGYMLVGSGTALFPIHVRGTAMLADEMPHIIAGLCAVTVMLVTIAVASPALGRRFQIFSWTMFASIIVFGALTVPSGMRLAAGEPTPGMGILERLAYYSMLLWVGILSVALVRRARS